MLVRLDLGSRRQCDEMGDMTAPRPPAAIRHPAVIEPDLPLLHDRTYSVRSYRTATDQLLLRGQVLDQKPPGLYVDDEEPLPIHHMIVDLVIALPDLEIVDAEVVMETHPHVSCLSITDQYHQLIGLVISRGFSRQVRELFGGPRGCTHTTALLFAMAPVAIQSMWSIGPGPSPDETPVATPLSPIPTDAEIQDRFAHTLNSCHVWHEDGEMVAAVRRGEDLEPPLWITNRYDELGRDPATWKNPLTDD